jgi:hypothetical protein
MTAECDMPPSNGDSDALTIALIATGGWQPLKCASSGLDLQYHLDAGRLSAAER